ncbi:hypothetical protein CYY_007182 [Polysphondylium violaceum]|uniref:Uncharacterized protein n=1 Tax=Polysphondylium violaceum TaxID=133409 RepID=A0A8J4V540_9MYCE|nr:hypothetical protein CYY_007182 [Polysphondylium violaceum]
MTDNHHPNPFSAFQPTSPLNTKFLDHYATALTNDFGDLHRFRDGQADDDDNYFVSRISSDSNRVQLDRNRPFVNDTLDTTTQDNYSYIGNLTNDSKHSFLVDSFIPQHTQQPQSPLGAGVYHGADEYRQSTYIPTTTTTTTTTQSQYRAPTTPANGNGFNPSATTQFNGASSQFNPSATTQFNGVSSQFNPTATTQFNGMASTSSSSQREQPYAFNPSASNTSTGTVIRNGTNSQHRITEEEYQNIELDKQRSLIESLRSQNKRLSQDSFIARYARSAEQKQKEELQRQQIEQQKRQQELYEQEQQQRQYQEYRPTASPIGEPQLEHSFRDSSFSFNVSQPNIDMTDNQFYGSSNQRFENRFSQTGNLINSTSDQSLIYSPEQHYQEEEEEQQQEVHNQQHEPLNTSHMSTNGDPNILINTSGEAKTPGSYFQSRSPFIGTISGSSFNGNHRPIFNDSYHNDSVNQSMRRDTVVDQQQYQEEQQDYDENQQYQQEQQEQQEHNETIHTQASNDPSFIIPTQSSFIGFTPERTGLDHESYKKLSEKYIQQHKQPTQLTQPTPPTQPKQTQSQHQPTQPKPIQQQSQPKPNHVQQPTQPRPIQQSQHQPTQPKPTQQQSQPKPTHIQQQPQHQPTQPKPANVPIVNDKSSSRNNAPASHGNNNNQQNQQQQKVNQVVATVENNINNNGINNSIIRYPVLIVEKKLEFDSCEIGWSLKKDLVITNPHSQSVLLANHSIGGKHKKFFNLILPDKLSSSQSMILIKPSSTITLQVEYSPYFIENDHSVEHHCALTLLCTSAQDNVVNTSKKKSTDYVVDVEERIVATLCIPIVGKPSDSIYNDIDLLYNYMVLDMGTSVKYQPIESNCPVQFNDNHKLLFECTGEGFSYEKTVNDQVTLKFSLPQQIKYNGQVIITDSVTGQKKIVQLVASVLNSHSSIGSPIINDPKRHNNKLIPSPTIVDSTAIGMTSAGQFQPKVDQSVPSPVVSPTSSNNTSPYVDNNRQATTAPSPPPFLPVIQPSSMPLKVSNFVLDSGIKFVYEERKQVDPIERLPIYNPTSESIVVECSSTLPDIFSVVPERFTIAPNSSINLKITYHATNNIYPYRAALLIATPELTNQKINIGLHGVIDQISEIYPSSSPPQPSFIRRPYSHANNNIDDYTSPSSSSTTVSPPTGDYQLNNDSLVFHQDENELLHHKSISKTPSLYCNRKVISFGGVKLGESKTLLITLTSTFAKSLHLKASISQIGSDNKSSYFSVSDPNVLVLPDSSRQVEITYTPLDVACHKAIISFESHYDKFIFKLPIRGYGGKAKIDIISSLRLDNDNKYVLYINKPHSAEDKSLSCTITVKNTGQRPGFIKSIGSYPNSTVTVFPDSIVLPVGAKYDLRYTIQPNSPDKPIINSNSSTISYGKFKFFIGDEIARQRARKGVDRDDINKENILTDFLFEDGFKYEQDWYDINDGLEDEVNLKNFEHDDLELFGEHIQTITINPIIGNPSLGNGSIPTTTATTTTIKETARSPSVAFNPSVSNVSFSSRNFGLSEIDLNTSSPFKPEKSQVRVNHFHNQPDEALRSILKKPAATPPSTQLDKSKLKESNNLLPSFEDSKHKPSKPNPQSQSQYQPTATSSSSNFKPNQTQPPSYQYRHNHIHISHNDERQQPKMEEIKAHTPPSKANPILFFQEPETFETKQGTRAIQKILLSNASVTPINVKLSLLYAPFSHNHPEITLAPQTSTKIPIAFQPTKTGSFSQKIFVESIPKFDDPIIYAESKLVGICK